MDQVKFTAMKDGDAEDYAFLDRHERDYAAGTAQRLMRAMAELDESLSGYRVTRLEHSVQSASRAWRDGADDDWVVATLLHDIGDIYAPWNHDEYAAAVLRPFVRDQCAWVVEKHGLFQRVYYAHHLGGDPDAREAEKDHPYYEDCVAFCARWDQASFDPDYPSFALAAFAPMVERVFARPPRAPDVVRPGAREPLTVPGVAAARDGASPS